MKRIQNLTKSEIEKDPRFTRLTRDNAKQFIGFNVVYRTRQGNYIDVVRDVSEKGKTIQVDNEDLKNNLQIVSRVVFAFSVEDFKVKELEVIEPEIVEPNPRKTIRDDFAMAALSGLLSTQLPNQLAVRNAYQVADLMLKERKL